MRNLPLTTTTALTSTVTKPITLIELGFSQVMRLSTRGNINYGGFYWSGSQNISVSGISADGSGNQGGVITIGNTDLSMGAVVLGEGVGSVSVKIFHGDADALEDGQMSVVFNGVVLSAEVGGDVVTLNLSSNGAKTLYSPRRFIGQSSGFNHLIATGTILKFGTTTYTLERK